MEKESYQMHGQASPDLLNERPPAGYTWSGWRLTRKQTTSRPDNVWPDLWKHVSDAAKKKAKRSKSGLSRNQSSITPDGHVVSSSVTQKTRNSNTTSKKVVESWRFRCQQQCFVRHNKLPRGNLPQCWETQDPMCLYCRCRRTMRKRLEGVPYRYQEDHISEKGIIHWTITIWYTSLIRCLKHWKFRMWRQQWKTIGKIGENTGMAADKSQKAKKEVIEEARNKRRRIHFASLMDLCHLKNSEMEPQFQSRKVELYSEAILWKIILDLM